MKLIVAAALLVGLFLAAPAVARDLVINGKENGKCVVPSVNLWNESVTRGVGRVKGCAGVRATILSSKMHNGVILFKVRAQGQVGWLSSRLMKPIASRPRVATEGIPTCWRTRGKRGWLTREKMTCVGADGKVIPWKAPVAKALPPPKPCITRDRVPTKGLIAVGYDEQGCMTKAYYDKDN